MLLAGAGCVFMGFILYISGVHGRPNSICALKGSSVHLTCSKAQPTSSHKWYTLKSDGKVVMTEVLPDGHRVTYNMSDNNRPTLTIKDLRESDAQQYCCMENTDKPLSCKHSGKQLHVADLQVKVFPSTEGHTVTLMCNTSCPLTKNPVNYSWYKNREYLYNDWSPWYQELVSSNDTVRYSCAVKGYEDLRAPEVSVDSVTATCINVTYAKGRMCSDKGKSDNESCSITNPTEVQVQRTFTAVPILNCSTNCPLTDPQPAYRWYKNKTLQTEISNKDMFVASWLNESFACAVKGFEELLSPEVCVDGQDCWTVNYASRRICTLYGSSVTISSVYSHPNNQLPQEKVWYKIYRNDEETVEKKITAGDRVQYRENGKNHHTLTIKHLKKNDSAEYRFRLQTSGPDLPGVTLVVTGVRVKLDPAEATEGQRITLTCLTSCPLPVNTTYRWYFNSQPLTVPQGQNKRLVLDPVSSQQAGNYSCATETSKISREKTLTVLSITEKHKGAVAAAGVCAALLIIIPLLVFFGIRRQKVSGQPPTADAAENTEQLSPGPVYESTEPQPTEQDDVHYSQVHFCKTQADPLYCTIQPHQPTTEDCTAYAVVNFRPGKPPK